MRSKIEPDDSINVNIIYLDKDMDDEETDVLFKKLDELDKIVNKNLIISFPEKFTLKEHFRKTLNDYLRKKSHENENFKVAIVTTLMNVKGYETFAKWMNGLVERQSIFENMANAREWISSS
ncbi:MAG: hypothetical protein ACTSVI_17565 [Promethearchaeota archaeon]